MSDNALLATVGKPKIGGSIFRASVGTALPTTAVDTLNEAFNGLGYISDEGVVNSTEFDTDDITAWGGTVVLNAMTSKKDKFQFSMLEAMNIEVLKTVHGDSNVTGTLAEGIAINVNSHAEVAHSYVIDMIYNNNSVKRIVIPNGYVSEIGDVTYVDGDAVKYDVTISATPDASGNTHYEYIKKTS